MLFLLGGDDSDEVIWVGDGGMDFFGLKLFSLLDCVKMFGNSGLFF